MLQVEGAILGYAIEAGDSKIGTVSEFLFDDRTWKIRWLVVDTGNWLTGRVVLIHPSAIGRPDTIRRVLPVGLTRQQIEAGPVVLRHRPVSRQVEYDLYDYYGWDPAWDSGFYGADATGDPTLPSHPFIEPGARGDSAGRAHLEARDPHLRGLSAVAGSGIHASDGIIGLVENVLLEDDEWGIASLIVSTGTARPGKQVLISPETLRAVDWSKQQVFVDISRDRIDACPPWAPVDMAERGERRLRRREFDRPRYGSMF